MDEAVCFILLRVVRFIQPTLVNITALYFPEFNYNNYEIIDDGNECGLYQIMNSSKEELDTFDPRGNLNLKYFLVYGYDSYVEILCSDFDIQKML